MTRDFKILWEDFEGGGKQLDRGAGGMGPVCGDGGNDGG